MTWIAKAAAVVLVAVFAATAAAEPTQVAVRVLSRGAKFVGTSMGGARVVLRDAHTGQILASGITQGSTGDTKRIMNPQPDQPLWTQGAAQFVATLDLAEPTKVEATVTGPLAQPQAMTTVSSTQWIVPGRSVTAGDGWLIELPGLVVDVLSPPAAQKMAELQPVPLRANVMMMCGCPLTPGGIWDAESYEVQAVVSRDGKRLGTVPLKYAGQPSQFEGTYRPEKPGTYDVSVIAQQPSTHNTGIDRTTFTIDE